MSKDPRKRAYAIIERWRHKLLLQSWSIHVEFICEDIVNDDGGGDVTARISADANYMDAKVQIFPAWARKSAKVQEECLVHELAHCLTEELKAYLFAQHSGQLIPPQLLMQAVERCTQRITIALTTLDRSKE